MSIYPLLSSFVKITVLLQKHRFKKAKWPKCFIGEIMKVREGTSAVCDRDTFPCGMGKSCGGVA